MILYGLVCVGSDIQSKEVPIPFRSFKGDHGAWEYKPFTPTERMRMAISFPIARDPQGISVAATPGASTPFVKRPGTGELLFTIDSAVPGSLYRADWSW